MAELRKKKRRSVLEPMEEKEGTTHVVQEIRVSATSVVKVIGIVVLAYFLWSIKEVLGVLFVSWVLASALDPWVDRLQRYGIPRGISILSMYLVIILVFGAVVYLLIPPLINQMFAIAGSLQGYAPQINSFYQYITQNPDVTIVGDLQRNVLNFNTTITNLTSGLFGAVSGVFGGLLTLMIAFVFTFYLTVEEDGVKKFVRSVAPIQYQPYLVQKTNRIQHKMGAWLRGQLILMLIIGLLAFIGLSLLHVQYALVLGVVAGLVEFIPFLGPLIAAIPAVFFAWSDSPWKAVGVVILYVVLQQIENQAIVPKLMQKAVGLNPIVIIAVMLVGARVAGLVGVILAVPATTIVWIFLEDLFIEKIKQDNLLETPTGEVEDEMS